jgi:plastocyanin
MGRLLAVGLIVIAALVAVLVTNGEGPNKPEEQQAETPAAVTTTATSPAPAQATGTQSSPGDEPSTDTNKVGATVRMKDLRFKPGAVSVSVGQAVRFVNDDDVDHTVLEDVGPRSGKATAVDSGRIAPGETFEFVVRGNGLVPYICTLHPSVMIGQVLAERPAA